MHNRRSVLITAAGAMAAGLVPPGEAAAQLLRSRQRSLQIHGAGASFPAPLYLAWFRHHNRETPGVNFNYQSTGSGAGTNSFINRLVDFAASDAAMNDEQIARVNGGALVLPMTAGEIVLAYNLPGVDRINLPRDVYPRIFSGEITRWNDPAIVAANPDATLPDQSITAITRSDSSGTTFVFVQHLAAIHADWPLAVGTSIQWPRQPNFIAAPRNDGVAAQVSQTPGAIGYMEYFFASATNLQIAALQNAAGNFVSPEDENSGESALASAEITGDDLRIWITDPHEPDAYPITTLTWMLFFRQHGRPEVASAIRDFVTWAMGEGQSMAADLGYVPLPEKFIQAVLKQVPEIQ